MADDLPSVRETLAAARASFTTKLRRSVRDGAVPPLAPEGLLRLVRYLGPLGGMAAFVGPLTPEARRPAVIWLPGEFASGLREEDWLPGEDQPDCTGAAFAEAGLQLMIPAYRGGNDNPGSVEAFYGEVEDVLAAAEGLARSARVDPERIYLAGHSTGATLALLVAECSARFRSVFAFGPVADLHRYGEDPLPFDVADPREWELRAPVQWLHGIRTPTFIFEGAHKSNRECLEELQAAPHPDCVSFHLVENADHFSVVAPLTRLIAAKIRADSAISFSREEIAQAVRDEA
jgi:acetyl esterase/lipase